METTFRLVVAPQESVSMAEKRKQRQVHQDETGQALKRQPPKEERDRSAEEVNADQPSVRGKKPKRAPKR
ncbi:hypothetical protein [Streptomyces sp. NPDC048196]|uniref:hypothetical protein n=1 Tax=Streptomyces sp. NPDC048196 TaxID=3154712 RepID=UPI0033C866AE